MYCSNSRSESSVMVAVESASVVEKLSALYPVTSLRGSKSNSKSVSAGHSSAAISGLGLAEVVKLESLSKEGKPHELLEDVNELEDGMELAHASSWMHFSHQWSVFISIWRWSWISNTPAMP